MKPKARNKMPPAKAAPVPAMQGAPVAPAPTSQPGPAGPAIDVEPMIAKAKAGVPANLQPILDKVILSGMRIMFDRSSHQMALAELNKPGPLAQRLTNGMVALMYLLWTQSNKTIPPQLMVPATLILTLRAFQFLQLSKDPEATKQVLGDAVHDSVQGVMDRFGATAAALPSLLKGGQKPGAPPATVPAAPAAPQPQGGMIDAAQGA